MENFQLARLITNIGDTLRDALHSAESKGCLVIFDTHSELARLLTAAYRANLSQATFVDFGATEPAECIVHMNAMQPGDLVVLIQTANFRLNEFRIRLELFKRGLKAIEHAHVGRMSADQYDAYIDTLAYDAGYYRTLGPAIKGILDAAQHEVIIECFGGTQLRYQAPMETAKLNIGDYTGMKNIGGSFPIGEVFTEARDLHATQGELMIFGFGDMDFHTRIVEPFKATVRDGILTAPDAPKELQEILDLIRRDETVLVRELGFGLNPAVSKTRIVNDVNTFERQYGVHVSLGHKHAQYKKPGFVPRDTKYHLDIYLDVSHILVDGVPLFENGRYVMDTKRPARS